MQLLAILLPLTDTFPQNTDQRCGREGATLSGRFRRGFPGCAPCRTAFSGSAQQDRPTQLQNQTGRWYGTTASHRRWETWALCGNMCLTRDSVACLIDWQETKVGRHLTQSKTRLR
ncbi:hypothetical protein LZ32DRAFT_146209 [Colletotrichum eremochloae]|nr:hypothetical protein LZ32DRAFT_146209 [Colletotrichum eremochloae]